MRARTPLSSLFGLSVLVIDADPVSHGTTRTSALRLGLAVDWADDAGAALRALRSHPVDAVLLDFGRAPPDALATARAIRALPARWAGLPIIGIADSPDDTLVERCRDAGLDACLAKPATPHALVAALAALCGPGADDHAGTRPWFDATTPATDATPAPRAHRPRVSADAPPGTTDDLLRVARAAAVHPLTDALLRAAERHADGVEPAVRLSAR